MCSCYQSCEMPTNHPVTRFRRLWCCTNSHILELLFCPLRKFIKIREEMCLLSWFTTFTCLGLWIWFSFFIICISLASDSTNVWGGGLLSCHRHFFKYHSHMTLNIFKHKEKVKRWKVICYSNSIGSILTRIWKLFSRWSYLLNHFKYCYPSCFL